MSPVVSIDRSSGRVMVLASGVLPVPLIRVAGVWEVGTFSADDLKDNCERVTDSKEATYLVQEAAAALESNPSLAND